MNSHMHRADIDYPTTWLYKIIGEDEEALRAAAIEIVGLRSHRLELSNTSSSKRYVSLSLQVVVEDEEARLGIFEQLKASDAIRIVL